MISPVVVKLAIQNLERVGNVVGKIYAVSTLGSIIGTFLAGFYLISWMGTRNILLLMGIILTVTAVIFGSFYKKRRLAATVILLPFLFILGTYTYAYKPILSKDVYYYNESDYFTIKLRKATASDDSTMLDALVLDNLIHSYVDLKDPLHIAYKYERIYAEILKWKFPRYAFFSSLTIGGGGYTFPRYMEAFYPNARIEVVEIDPEITKIAHTYLGLPDDTGIRSYNTDGRWFVMNCQDRYDLIFTDAYNDLSIPYHLTTKEFASYLNTIMKPEGILLSNIIDDFQKGAFLPSYMRTLVEVFGENNVRLISVSPHFKDIGISTFIVIAWKGNLDMEKFGEYLKNDSTGVITSALVPQELLHELFTKRHSVILTDDYAPVDNLIAPIFEARFGYNRKNR
jgi:spermidine synthase